MPERRLVQNANIALDMPDGQRDRDARFDRLVEEQAALRRVATLVGRGVSPAEVFEAVSVEVAGLFGAESGVARFEPDGDGMVLVGLSEGMRGIPIGTRWPLEDFLACTEVHRTGRPARSERSGWEAASGPAAESLRQMNPVSMVAAPIVVEGDLWGVITVADTRKSLPANAEERVDKFTELVATAISNADSRWALGQLVEEQAALRRVAMHVARGAGPAELFNAVSVEVARLFDAEAGIARFEAEGSALVFVGLSEGIRGVAIGTRWELEGFLASKEAYRTGRPARSDRADWQHASGPVADALKENELGSIVSAPIIVEGESWGVIAVAETRNSLPLDAEHRLEKFTEMVATAIANAEGRAELAASEATARELAREQAALRHVATQVARGVSSDELFAVVSSEVGELFEAEATVARFEADGPSIITVGQTPGIQSPIGTRIELEEFLASTKVYRTGRAARNSHSEYLSATGSWAEHLRRQSQVRPSGRIANPDGFYSTVGAPIVVEGSLWGVVLVTHLEAPPPGAEERVERFAELVGTAIANAESRAALSASEARAHELAGEQAALRRVATLVARAPASEQLFSTVAREIASVLEVPGVIVTRYDADGMALTLGEAFGPDLASAERFLGAGTRMPPDPGSLAALVHDTRSPARIDDFSTLRGTAGELAAAAGLGSGCAGPIMVNGALWGKLCVFSRVGTVLPAGTENRLHDFVELVATAIANYESRAELAASEARARALAEEQAALRRVATLVARGAGPSEVFAAVSQEIGRLLGSDQVAIMRYLSDGSEFVVVGGTEGIPEISRQRRWPLDDVLASAEVYRTRRPARRDHGGRRSAPGPLDDLFSAMRPLSTVATPIVVEGELWGCVTVSTGGAPLPPDAEERAGKFTELVATAIANADSREALAVSRARIIAAADDARRRIERDLHDGAQQRLVTLAVALRRTEAKIPAGLDDLREDVTRVAEGLTTAVDELRELSRGIHPSILTEGGLSPALKALGRRSAVRVKLDVGFDHRLPDHVEVAAYYTVSEAITNAAKHANAKRVWVSLRVERNLLLSIRDDGVGGADPSRGSGLTGLRDRIEALGGELRIESRPGRGTGIEVQIPILQPLDRRAQEERPPPTRTSPV